MNDVVDDISSLTLNIAKIRNRLWNGPESTPHYHRIEAEIELDDIVVVVERLVDDVGDEISKSTLNIANIHVQDIKLTNRLANIRHDEFFAGRNSTTS